MKEAIWHGGDLATAKALFPQAPEPWIDLSTGINPIPYPLPELPLSLWQRLPGKADEAALLAAARAAYRIRPESGLVAAPGTQILIELLPRVMPAAKVAVLGPTYGEHAPAWRKAGATVQEIGDLAEIGGANVVVLVNPNNPDGRIVSQEALIALAGSLAARGGLLVVDEAFTDFAPETSLLPILPEGALILRSFGKAYGLAGLRLGFAVGESRFTDALLAMLGPWAVAGPALHVGAVALGYRKPVKPAPRTAGGSMHCLLHMAGSLAEPCSIACSRRRWRLRRSSGSAGPASMSVASSTIRHDCASACRGMSLPGRVWRRCSRRPKPRCAVTAVAACG